jgi:Tfp pilus tip-associated adhesin PilY1
MGTSNVTKRIAKHMRQYALGAAVAAALALPTTALGWDYAQVPLFWDTGVHPNVALMLDDSGSMQAIVTNESFNRAVEAGTLSTQNWYWCNNDDYNPTTGKCGTKDSSAINGFAVLVWAPPTVSSSNWTNGRKWVTGTTSPGSCSSNSSDNGFFKSSAGTTSGTSYVASGLCVANHAFTNGDVVRYVSPPSSGGGTSSLSTATTYYVVNRNTHGFQLSTSFNGAPITFNVTAGTSGSFTFSGFKPSSNLPSYISGETVSLCDVTKAPGSLGYSIGESGASNGWLNSNTLPTADTVGVLVSNNTTTGGGTRDSCVRWKLASTARSTSAATPSGRDYNRYSTGTLYYTPGTSGTDLYGRHLLNTLLPAVGSANINFDNSALYPNTDTDILNFVPAIDNKIIPNVTRMEAARESAQQIVLDNYTRMQIGLFSFSGSGGEMNQAIGDGSNPTTEKTALISTTEGMTASDLPASALDGAIGVLNPETATPLALTQATINNYFKGGSSPIKYRCQKNYAVVMTDGDPTSDTGTLDANAQTGYDTDCKTSGTDTGGKSYNTTEFGGIWAKQNVVTFTVGFGLENDLLKRTPLVNSVNALKSDITGNKVKIVAHGLVTGDYVQVVSGAATGLTSGSYYYAAKIDGDTFKLATTKAKSKTCAAGVTGDCISVTGGAGTMVMSTGPGKALFSFTPEGLATALGDVFNKINALVASASAVSTNSKQLGADTLVYQARFNTEDWSGEVAAYAVNPVTGKVNTAAAPAWTTKTKLDTVGERGTLLTWNVDSNAGAPFNTLADLGATQSAKLNGDINAMNWLKGNDIAAPAGFRSHSINGLMGDIINADPVFVGALNFGYQTLPASDLGSCSISGMTATGTGCTGAEVYAAYLANRKATATPMLFAGTNGGAMHVLNSTSGSEIMAYYPAGVFEGWDDINNNGVKDAGETEKKLYNLTQSTYDHRFFVDGAGTTSDAFIGSSWKAFFVGGLGAGGRSVYAIDASDASFGPSDIKWEFTNTNLGYSYGKPTIARFSNNKWYAVFPNGTDSNGDKASVFVVSLTNASDYHELTVSNGDSAASPNGMMTVAVSQDNERTAEYIYAGDMKGNIWKFYVGGGAWPSGTKLFTAKDSGGLTQSITGGLRIGKHPASLGNLVYFGTGKYFENVDKDYKVSSVPQIDSFYAVLDDGTTNMTRGSLQVQTFTTTGGLRTGSTNVVDYTTKQGWYIDLTVNGAKQGERVISTPVLSGSRLIFVSIVPSGGDKCISNGTSWLNELDALDGSMLDEKVLDTDNDGDIDASDTKVTSVQLDGMASEPSILDGGDGQSEKKIMGSTSASSSIITVTEKKGATESLGGSGRMSWQQIQ